MNNECNNHEIFISLIVYFSIFVFFMVFFLYREKYVSKRFGILLDLNSNTESIGDFKITQIISTKVTRHTISLLQNCQRNI